MTRYECAVCGYIYDPVRGEPESGIAPGTPFEALAESYLCPVCGAGKGVFFAVGEVGVEAAPQVAELKTSIREIIQRTPTVKSFRLALKHDGGFKAGQYLKLSLEGKSELTKCLSISSSPTEEGYLEVTKRITGSEFSKRLDKARPGYEVSIAYPLGTFFFEQDLKKIALLSGGIGITPLRSICKYVVDSRLGTDVCLLYSNRSEEEIAFRADFDEMLKKGPNLKVVHTLSRAGADWPGRRGRIDARLVRDEIPDYTERCFYLCGPPQMVETLRLMLSDEIGLAAAQLRTEDFSGY